MTQPLICVVCQRREVRSGMVCDHDRGRMDRTLVEIPELYVTLDDQLVPGQAAGGEKVSGSREAPLPLRVDPLDLTMPARAAGVVDHLMPQYEIVAREVEVYLPVDPHAAKYVTETVTMRQRQPRMVDGEPVLRPSGDQVGAVGVASTLDSWVQDWRTTIQCGSVNPLPTVSELSRWLRIWLDTACQDHPAIDDFADEMFKLVKVLRVAAGVRGDRTKVGNCPVCGAVLTADPYLDLIRCGRCETQWARDKWIWLGLTIRAA